jgi:hypothetical protein
MRTSEDLDIEMLSGLVEQPAEDPAIARPVAQSAADLAPDPAASIDDAIDQITAQLAAFCFEQLERSVTSCDALDLNADVTALEDEFQVRHYMIYIAREEAKSLYSTLATQIVSVISDDSQRSTPDITRDSEQPSLPLEAPDIEAARELFLPEEEDEPADIMEIIQTCLKDVQKHNSKHAIKALTLLIAVSEYIKLRTCYNTSKACKQPCLKASIAIARRMGKGPYFARQIRYNELYLLKHRHLPHRKLHSREGHHSLLDNESVLHGVRVYLATQVLGSVMPRTLCQHVNDVLLPALGMQGSISESTAQRWLRFRLGYQCKEAKRGIYIDGHERPDVIKERKQFLDELGIYEQYVHAFITR